MTDAPSSQAIFERYLRGELSQETAVEAILAAMKDARAAGTRMAPLHKPDNVALLTSDLDRADALFAELDRRAARG
jgi:hypothetical protein